jgi:tetratricopeptide (TPR) repeat protein
VDSVDLLDHLAALVDGSLVRQERAPTAPGEPWFVMLQTVREFAAEQLRAGGEEQAVRGAVAKYYLTKAADHPKAQGDEWERWLAVAEQEHDNVRAVLDWCEARGDAGSAEVALALGVTLASFWSTRGHVREGRARLERALALAGDTPASSRAEALAAAGILARAQGDTAAARRHLGDALAVFRTLGDRASVARVLNRLANAVSTEGDAAAALPLYRESLREARAQGDREGTARALNNLGITLRMRGDLEEARAVLEEALALALAVGSRVGQAKSLANLADVAGDQGDRMAGRAFAAQSLALHRAIGDQSGIADSLRALAGATASLGDARRAALLFGAAAALRDALETPVPANAREEYAARVEGVRVALGNQAFDAAWAEGEALPLEEAVALALEDEASRARDAA